MISVVALHKAIGLTIGFGITLTATIAVAAPPSDTEVIKGIVGSWITPPSSSDYGPFNEYAVDTYYADGSEVAVFYSDTTCKKIVNTLRAEWTMQNGVLITHESNGIVQHAIIVSVERNSLTYHSLDDGTTFTRERGTICNGPPIS